MMPSQPESTITGAVRLAHVFVRIPKRHRQNDKSTALPSQESDSSEVTTSHYLPTYRSFGTMLIRSQSPEPLPLATTAQTASGKGAPHPAETSQTFRPRSEPSPPAPNPRPYPHQKPPQAAPHRQRPTRPIPQNPLLLRQAPPTHRHRAPTALTLPLPPPPPLPPRRLLLDPQVFDSLPA